METVLIEIVRPVMDGRSHVVSSPVSYRATFRNGDPEEKWEAEGWGDTPAEAQADLHRDWRDIQWQQKQEEK